ncbi:uncharacterized protein LOC112045562 [Bicyclus anynana]|uniref:Uncharacterized protein LOC112045562 n=1 Tax=Bicyclus anynana TaxID=110368 RepID=A0A6J1MPQ0_BICAN|nr:uncharacterized protein LOC112045562 [Bicyclus anynana]
MAVGNVYFLVFTALVAVNIIFADDSLLSDANQAELVESGSREKRNIEEVEDRLFFSLFPIITTCNYTATPGNYCGSCTQAVRCLPNNNGVVRNCRGLLRYCNGGRCSFIPDPVACNGTITG